MSKKDYIILIGPPNSGKTTVFNWLTGYNKQTVNYPGSTVDISLGLIRKQPAGYLWKAVDTPGIYGFFSSSSEGKATQNILRDSLKNKELRGLILVLDATRLQRQLSFAFQLKEAGLPFVLALSMYDIQKKESTFDFGLLSRILNVPVCPIEGLLGGGVAALINKARVQFKHKANSLSLSALSAKWSEKKQENYLKQAVRVVDKIQAQKAKKQIGKKTKKLDSWFLHPVFGFGFLSLILFVFFSGIFWLAQPLMNLIDGSFGLGIGGLLKWGGGHFFVDFLANAVLTGFRAFLIFVPQVFILFFGLYLLEDSGYLARAVSLVDGPFSRIGLSGRSLFPFLSGFACAIPATLAARAISSKRERWITIFVLPFMTCSARLPVYALLLGFLFYGDSAWKPGLSMALIYFLSLLLGMFSAGILNLFLKKDKSSSFFMELPLYRRPVLWSVLSSSWSRTKHFVFKSGPVIFSFAILMWVVTHFPRSPELTPVDQVQQSYAGRFGQVIEPVFEKMGGDWRVGVSLLSAFVAREVFVSVLAVTLKNTETEESQNNSLIQTMKASRFPDGGALFSKAGVMALLVFFMLSLQCLSTTGIVYKETGSWSWAAAQLASLNLLAYIGAVVTYNIFS